jgi:hypothetical protein
MSKIRSDRTRACGISLQGLWIAIVGSIVNAADSLQTPKLIIAVSFSWEFTLHLGIFGLED